MSEEKAVEFPRDISTAISIARRLAEFLSDEANKKGLTMEEVISHYESTFDSNDEDIARLFTLLKKEEDGGPHIDAEHDLEVKQRNKTGGTRA